MKVVICSLAGSVGKTTITSHLIYQRLQDTKIFAVDKGRLRIRNLKHAKPFVSLKAA